MAKHLSIRLPWHDRGWDGHVCDHPTANVYCSGEYGLKAHGIREGKDDKQEEAMCGTGCDKLKPNEYRPPCLRTIQAFGGEGSLPFQHEPKAFLNTDRVTIAPVADQIPPYAAGTWAYDRVFRREDAGDDVPEEFTDRYTPGEAIENIRELFDELKPKKSVAFYYLNYDNPLNSERRRYVLVGAAEIDSVSKQQYWEEMDPAMKSRYGPMVWNRFITSGYGAGRGARIPYETYVREALDPAAVMIEVPLELSQHFKYVCRHFTDDEAAIFLMLLLEALERGQSDTQQQVKWDWAGQIAWVKTAYANVLNERGIFPGLAAVLQVLGFTGAAVYVERCIRAKGIKDPRQHALSRLHDPSKAEDKPSAAGFKKAANTLSLLSDSVQKLLLDRLCLFDLTAEQIKTIAGGDLIPQEDRERAGLTSSPEQILNNPYLIVEEYDPADPDDRILFYRIDNGVFLAKNRAGGTVPGVETFEPDDSRRLRAAAAQILRDADGKGHTFLLQSDLLRQLSALELPGITGSLGTVALAKDLAFYQEILALRKEGELVAWQMKTLAEDEELIRGRVAKLRQRKALPNAVQNWSQFLPKDASKDGPLAEARASQKAALEKLAVQPFSILTGGAGTGKTSVLAAFIRGTQSTATPEKFLLLTPTGKAAVRLKRRIIEVAGSELEPRTIHSYLSKEGWLDWSTWRPLRDAAPVADGTTTVIIDECSMLDLPLLTTVFRALDWTKVRRLILCGDPQQLPPIGVGAPFRNLIDALRSEEKAASSISNLTVNCRQIQEKSIGLKLAEMYTDRASSPIADELMDSLRPGGTFPPDLEIRFFKDEFDLPAKLSELLEQAMRDLLRIGKHKESLDPKKPWETYDLLHGFNNGSDRLRLDAIEVLSAFRAGYHGSDAFNTQLQQRLRGKLFNSKWTLKLGKPSGRQFVWPDKVLQIQNIRGKAKDKIAWKAGTDVDFYVANGELGKLAKLDKWKGGKNKGQKYGKILFETSPDVWITIDAEWAETKLDLGYALTVHKAQGSDFGAVILVLPREERQQMLTRELLYTALTRFTQRLYLLVQGEPGDLTPLYRCLWRGSSAYLSRNTSLYKLREAVPDLDDYRPEQRIHRSLRDELVRSKSELVITTRLAHYKVPYYYEKPLFAPDGSVRRPDFTIPVENPDPDVLYWEHWGMKGDPAYDASMERRRQWYKKHGWLDKLIETDEVGGFDVTKIDKIIQERLVP